MQFHCLISHKFIVYCDSRILQFSTFDIYVESYLKKTFRIIKTCLETELYAVYGKHSIVTEGKCYCSWLNSHWQVAEMERKGNVISFTPGRSTTLWDRRCRSSRWTAGKLSNRIQVPLWIHAISKTFLSRSEQQERGGHRTFKHNQQ